MERMHSLIIDIAGVDGSSWVGWYSGKDALTDHRHSRGGWQ